MSEIEPRMIRAMTHIASMGRRDFLKFASIAAGLAAFSGMPRVALGALPPGIRFMNESEYAVFHRLMEVMLPVRGTALAQLDQIPVMQTLDGALLATMEPHILQGLKGGVQFFNDGPKAAFGKRFVELTDEEAARFCDNWADSNQVPHRALAMGLKKLVGLSYWANPPTWEAIGYDGPVSKRWGLKPLGNTPMPKH